MELVQRMIDNKERGREREGRAGCYDSCIMGIMMEALPGARQVSDAAQRLTVRLTGWKQSVVTN